jgi:hypothetical protein
MLAMAGSLLTVQDLAAMANRNIVTDDEGRALAGLTGYTPEDFDRFNLLGGEPPDLTAVILAWQRGVIGESDVDRAIVQGPIRKEWIPVVKQLRWSPLPVTEAADAVNQGHLDLAKATAIAAQSGLRPEDFAVIVNNAGIPPGPMEALDWVNRGLITEAEFRTAFLESRIKNKYIDPYLASRHHPLTLAEIRMLYSRGVMDEAAATTRLMQRGYAAADAVFIIAGAHAEKSAATRNLNQSQVVALYEDRAIDEPTAAGMLDQLGYDATEVGWLLALADARRGKRFADAVISRVRAAYVAWHLDDTEATSTLDALAVPATQRDDLLVLWGLERDAVRTGLSTAQIQTAHRKGLLDDDGATLRLRQRGYSAEDAAILIKLAPAPAGA